MGKGEGSEYLVEAPRQRRPSAPPPLEHAPRKHQNFSIASQVRAPERRGPGGVEAMRRVVVTGVGVVAPNGVGREAFWNACLNGRSGVGPLRTFDGSNHPVKVAAEVHDFDVMPFVPSE